MTHKCEDSNECDICNPTVYKNLEEAKKGIEEKNILNKR